MSRPIGISDEAILEAILSLTTRDGFPPTVRELMAATGFKSPGSMRYRLLTLRERRRIAFDDRRARSLRVVRA